MTTAGGDQRLFFYGGRVDLRKGDLIDPGDSRRSGSDDESGFVDLADTFDAASWQAETASGDGPGRIYMVVPTGPIVDALDPIEGIPPRLAPSFRSRDPLRVVGEVTDAEGRPALLYHGTKADLKPGDLIQPGHSANFGDRGRVANHVYLAGTLDAAVWGAELARGDGPGRVYVVEPTGPITDDPNVTNARFPGNPTKSYRSREPLRVTEEVADWQAHPPEVVKAMKDGLAQLRERGADVIDD